MGGNLELLNVIRQKRDGMSKGQKRLADYILANFEKAAFFTAMELGKTVGVSESTVVRFPSALGMTGYPQLQKELSSMVQEKIHSIERIEIAEGSMQQEQVLDNIMNADAEKIRLTLDGIDRHAFAMAVDDIIRAKHVYVVGVRSCSPLASFLAFYLNVARPDVIHVQSTNSSEMFEQMIHLQADDVVIGISFPRYSMLTLKAMEYANDTNAKVITITDSKHSPMNMYSSCNLFARSDMASVVDSLVAPLSLINALIVAVSLKKNKDVIGNIEKLDQILYDYHFESDEINLLDEDVMTELKRISGNESA
ncbi:MAG: MurR/RpiR family transcriptional regulator [Lachnospira sp.]|jgi:DNA-binding MurR/RpiR family transcriptional regulator|nr:MurR/RpiR family transcriptional regulator [Lachnospira sp.]